MCAPYSALAAFISDLLFLSNHRSVKANKQQLISIQYQNIENIEFQGVIGRRFVI